MINTIPEALADLASGKMIVVVDDEDRENEGDLLMAAEFATPQAINFMATYGRGLICLTLSQQRVKHLDLPPMAAQNASRHGTGFTISIEAREGITTGISAADRAHTIQTAISEATQPQDIVSPGHVFPLAARDGGVLVRAGHTEAGCDLARMAGCSESAVICEIMNPDGTMARLPQLMGFCTHHNFKIISIADLIEYRSRQETLVMLKEESTFNSIYGGEFQLKIFESTVSGVEHVALIKGAITNEETILVRMHSLNVLRDVLGQEGSGDAYDLHKAMQTIDKAGKGVLVLLREPRGDALSNTLKGNPPALKEYGTGAQILQQLGVGKMTLLTNHPKAIVGIDGYGLEINGYHPL